MAALTPATMPGFSCLTLGLGGLEGGVPLADGVGQLVLGRVDSSVALISQRLVSKAVLLGDVGESLLVLVLATLHLLVSLRSMLREHHGPTGPHLGGSSGQAAFGRRM